MRSPSVFRATLWVLAAALLPTGLRAHQDLEVRIAELTQSFARTGDAELLVRRADLYRRHHDWAKAGEDLKRALELGVRPEAVKFGQARLLMDTGSPARALQKLEGIEGVAAVLLRARVLARMGKVGPAAAAYHEAIKQCQRPVPEYFVEWAGMLAEADPPRLAQALTAVELGLEMIGPVISLQEEAFRIERQIDPTAALQRVREVNRTARRPKLRWLLREGELLLARKDAEAAAQALAAAKAHLEALPSRRRSSPAIQEMMAQVKHLEKKRQALSAD